MGCHDYKVIVLKMCIKLIIAEHWENKILSRGKIRAGLLLLSS